MGRDLKSLYQWRLLTVSFVVCLFVSPFVLAIGYTYDEVCPTCHGTGDVVCEECHGSGKCWVCNGTGEIWYMDDGWCAACQGTGKCYKCGGKGWHTCEKCGADGVLTHWMYSSLGATIVSSIILMLCFLGLFFLHMVSCGFYLAANEWVYEVRHMDFLFNPMFMIWLFATDRKRWAKWSIPFNLISGMFLGILLFALLSKNHITEESLLTGNFFSLVIIGVFSFIFYNFYTRRLDVSKVTT